MKMDTQVERIELKYCLVVIHDSVQQIAHKQYMVWIILQLHALVL